MSLSVNIIFGDKKSICRNDAYAVVDNTDKNEPHLLDIIPAYEIGNGRAEDVLSAFERAKERSHSDQETKTLARRALGLNASPAL